MRVGIDVRCLAEGRHTGVEEYTKRTLTWMFETRPEDQFVLFFNSWHGVVPNLSWALRYPNVSLKSFRYPNKLLNLCLWYLRFPKLDKLLGGVDTYFLPNLNFAAVSSGTRLVVTAHDLSFEFFPEAFSQKQRIWHYLINFRQLVRRADAIIAVSHSTKADLISEYGISPQKISVIHSGVSDEFRPLSRNNIDLLEVQKKYKLPYKFILSLGTFEPRKNTVATVHGFEAFCTLYPKLSENICLVLAGAYGWKSEELRQAVIQSPFRDRIHVIGYVAAEDKPYLFNLASVFVYPSLYEGFGFPPLEAIACGTPAIVSNVASLPEIMSNGAILIDPYRPDEIREALKAIFESSELKEKLIKAGLQQAQKFQWLKTAKETYGVLVGRDT